MSFPRTLASDQLQKWRKAKGLNQTAAAELFDVSQPTYSEYECGRKVPRTVKALEIQAKTEGAVQVSAWAEEAPESESGDAA